MWRSRGRGLVLSLLVVMAAPALGKVFGVPRDYRYLDYTDAAPSQEKVKHPSASGGERGKGECWACFSLKHSRKTWPRAASRQRLCEISCRDTV